MADKPCQFVIIIRDPGYCEDERPILEFDIQNDRTGEQLTGHKTTFNFEDRSQINIFKICRYVLGTQSQLDEWLGQKLPAWFCIDDDLSNWIGIYTPKIGLKLNSILNI